VSDFRDDMGLARHRPATLRRIGAAKASRAAKNWRSEGLTGDNDSVSRIDAASRVVSASEWSAAQPSANEVAARAADAAVRAADAALVAANAAIIAANAAVRLVDEHDNKVIVVGSTPAITAGDREAAPVIHLPARADVRDVAAPTGRAFAARAIARRALVHRPFAIALIVAGAILLADGVVTLAWQEPISALYATLRQDHLSGALARSERAAPTPAERGALEELARLGQQHARLAYLAGALQQHSRDGSAVARIHIPRIGVNFVVVYGTSTSALESGPGIYRNTVLPGSGGTTAIAGHRTTFLAPFRHIDSLRPGDAIRLDMPYGDFTYRVTGSRVVAPSDVHDAVAYIGYPRLVLSACTPLFSAAKRILVFARLTNTVALGAGRLSAPAPAAGASTAPASAPSARA
jgi:sortase A